MAMHYLAFHPLSLKATAIAIIAYSYTCVIALPGFAQAPVLLYPKLPLAEILLSSACGRILAVLTLCVVERRLGHRSLLERAKARSTRLIKKTLAFVERYGVWGMIIVVAIPGLPTRSPLYVTVLTRPNVVWLAVAYASASSIRDILVWAALVGFLRWLH